MTDDGRSTGLVIAAYAAIAILVIPVFPHFVSPNEFSRWLLAASLVEYGSVEVTPLAPLFGERFEDVSARDGRLYSNKAPGAALLAVPGYALGSLVAGRPSPQSLRVTLTTMRLVAATVPLILLALTFAAAAARFGSDSRVTAFVVFVLLFATPLFAYGLVLFSHALAAAALFAAWTLLFTARARQQDEILAGALLGLTVLSEYPTAVAVLVIVAALAWERRLATILRVTVGGMPFVAALAFYNTVAFGGPFEFSSGHERFDEFQQVAARGVFGIGLPSLGNMARLLVSPSKGLLVFSPVLLLGLAALPATRRRVSKSAFATLVGVPIALLLIYSGYPNWHGGWGTGARYLVAAIPFLVFPLFFRPVGPIGFLLAGMSSFFVAIVSLTFPFVPPAFAFPWSSLALPLLSEGLIAPNLLHLVAKPLALAAPLVLVLIAMGVAVPGRQVAMMALGFVLAAVMALAAQQIRQPTLAQRLQRAYIEEVYFERHGALSRLGIPLPSRLVARRDRELRLPPTTWRF